MKITNLHAVQRERPLARPMRNAQGATDRRLFTFVIVETDQGVTGIGDAFGDPLLMPAIIAKRLAPAAIGMDPLDLDGLWRQLCASSSFWETAGSVMCGVSAIEVACWDIRGKCEGRPVCDLLGGRKRESVEAYASDLHWEEPQQMADLARGYVQRGFRYVKTHIGAVGEQENDLRRCEAVREAIGPDVGFLIDINTAFDLETALSRGRELEAFDPFWYEEPLAPLDYRGHAQLRQELAMPIVTGENLYLREGFQPLWEAAACDYVMPDILRCGGLRQTQYICQDAVSHNVIPSPHNFSSGVGLAATLHLMAALEETQLLEFDPTGTAIYEEMFSAPLQVNEGMVGVPTEPGLGIRFDV